MHSISMNDGKYKHGGEPHGHKGSFLRKNPGESGCILFGGLHKSGRSSGIQSGQWRMLGGGQRGTECFMELCLTLLPNFTWQSGKCISFG